jgi:nitroreductase
MKTLYDLIINRRSIRKFSQRKIVKDVLYKLVNAGRLAPTAANLQPLEFLVIDDEVLLADIFEATRWAGYLFPDGRPRDGERPTAYIALLSNHKRSSSPDLRGLGAAAENILLAAYSFGLAGCWLGALDRDALTRLLELPEYLELDSLIALGAPAQESVVTDRDDTVEYWLDEKKKNLTVPKRPLDSVLHYNVVRTDSTVVNSEGDSDEKNT